MISNSVQLWCQKRNNMASRKGLAKKICSRKIKITIDTSKKESGVLSCDNDGHVHI